MYLGYGYQRKQPFLRRKLCLATQLGQLLWPCRKEGGQNIDATRPGRTPAIGSHSRRLKRLTPKYNEIVGWPWQKSGVSRDRANTETVAQGFLFYSVHREIIETAARV